jgi:uncharacterized protein YndB with AHSA1/START domain
MPSITISAPVEKVWAAITEPDLRKRWFFGVDTETNWQPGSPIVHRGEWEGKPYEDKGEIGSSSPATGCCIRIGARCRAGRTARKITKASAIR